MNPTPDQDAVDPLPTAESAEDRALRDAVDWSILLQDAPEDECLKSRFAAWHGATSYNRDAWQQAERLSGLIVQTDHLAFFPPPRRRPTAIRAPARWKAAAAVAVAAALAWVTVPQIILHASADHLTGTGEQRTVTLADGSEVRLAPESAIAVTYAGKERRVELLAGEAYFEVARDPHRPFRVAAGIASVTVLGTGFDVRMGNRTADVAVRHGRVRVDRGDSHQRVALLTSGEWTRFGQTGRVAKGHIAPDVVGGWSDRRLVSADRPLGEVIDDLRRYYSGTIIVTDPALKQRSVTGVFDAEDPVEAAKVIVQPHGAVVRRITPWIMLISSS